MLPTNPKVSRRVYSVLSWIADMDVSAEAPSIDNHRPHRSRLISTGDDDFDMAPTAGLRVQVL